jgi:hypothetical protein
MRCGQQKHLATCAVVEAWEKAAEGMDNSSWSGAQQWHNEMGDKKSCAAAVHERV